MLRYKTETRPGLVALCDIRPGNGAGPFLQLWSPHGAAKAGDMNRTWPQALKTSHGLAPTPAPTGFNRLLRLIAWFPQGFSRIHLLCPAPNSRGHWAMMLSVAELVLGHFFKTQPNPKFLDPTQPTKVFTRPNPTHHRHLVWHIGLYRKLYTTTVKSWTIWLQIKISK